MYTDPQQWTTIRHRIMVGGISARQVSHETGISMATLRKMLRHAEPVPRKVQIPRRTKLEAYIPTISQMLQQSRGNPDRPGVSSREIYECIRDQGYLGAQGSIRSYVNTMKRRQRDLWAKAYDQMKSLDREAAISLLMCVAEQARLSAAEKRLVAFSLGRRHDPELTHSVAFRWMRKVQQRRTERADIQKELGDIPDLDVLLDTLYEGSFRERNRALAILASIRGFGSMAICRFLLIEQKIYRTYLAAYQAGGAAQLFTHRPAPNRKTNSEPLKDLIFTVLHEPPSNYGVNRTTWTQKDLTRVLGEKGSPICKETIRRITHQAGWRWRKARRVLTSPDPDYSEKLGKVRSVLSGLHPDEAFFSIDEFGPFIVRIVGGRALTAPGEVRVVPEAQKSRGSLILTAALELCTNQVTHFYSDKKNTAEMIRMAETLVAAYSKRRKLYLSWDAASWHTSKRLFEWIETHNVSAPSRGVPVVETVPLPASAQFLNVIESVFSGMARAVIHNSDYADAEAAKGAIDRYFADRNAAFQKQPKQAGKTIWGREREPSAFSEANNAKDPAFGWNTRSRKNRVENTPRNEAR